MPSMQDEITPYSAYAIILFVHQFMGDNLGFIISTEYNFLHRIRKQIRLAISTNHIILLK